MLKEALKDELTQTEQSLLSSGFDVIGDIAVVRVDEKLDSKKELIASLILEKNKVIKTVLRQTSAVEGEYRIRGLEYLAGERKTTTLHRENGCVFHVDLSQVYFSPRLSHERLRVAHMVSPGETVVNMFAGVGAFSILIARRRPGARVFSIDKNPVAHDLQLANIRVNKVDQRVIPLLGDAGEIIRSSLRGRADRVLMPLPERASEFLPDAQLALKDLGGVIHFYVHVHADRNSDPIAVAVAALTPQLSRVHRVGGSRVVREVGPRWFEVGLDLVLGGKGVMAPTGGVTASSLPAWAAWPSDSAGPGPRS